MTLLSIPILYFTDTAYINSDKYRNVRYITYPTNSNYHKIKTIKTKNGSLSFSSIGKKEPIVIVQYDRGLNSEDDFHIGYDSSKKAQEQVEKFAKENSLEILTDFITTSGEFWTSLYTSDDFSPICFDRFFILGKKNVSYPKNKELSFSKSIYKDCITYDKKHKRIELIYNRDLEKKSHNFSSSILLHNMLFNILDIVQKNGYSIKSISSENFVKRAGSYGFGEFYIDIE